MCWLLILGWYYYLCMLFVLCINYSILYFKIKWTFLLLHEYFKVWKIILYILKKKINYLMWSHIHILIVLLTSRIHILLLGRYLFFNLPWLSLNISISNTEIINWKDERLCIWYLYRCYSCINLIISGVEFTLMHFFS